MMVNRTCTSKVVELLKLEAGEVVSAIGQAGLGAVNGVDDHGYLMGIITDGDGTATPATGETR